MFIYKITKKSSIKIILSYNILIYLYFTFYFFTVSIHCPEEGETHASIFHSLHCILLLSEIRFISSNKGATEVGSTYLRLCASTSTKICLFDYYYY